MQHLRLAHLDDEAEVVNLIPVKNFLAQAAAAEVMAANQMAVLKARGYRRVSNKHGMLARVDRPDWVEVLARHLKRSPAELYVPGEPEPAAHWADYYRRVLSGDRVDVEPPALARLVPSSDHDPVGYVDYTIEV